MTQREAQRARTRAAIVQTAAAMIDDRGYLGTSIRDVARALDLTVGAIFFHFPAKDDLGRAVLRESQVRWTSLVDAARTRPGPRLHALVWLTGRAAEAYVDDVHVRAAVRLVRERALRAEVLPTPHAGWVAVTAELLGAAAEAGELAPGLDVEPVAYQIVCTWSGNQQLVRDLDTLDRLPERLQDMWRAYLPLLVGERGLDLDAVFAAD
ncbi:ScbR family autoregulator-binding transcription factor [Cellulomonas hominis]|uniref:ScbR family autoregulator-binding transcription factor n=1 Tax=Cellulomonas hominis TaxID=156981 RepID=UPI001B940E62|nr:ScbR family autoregulator-binding transcription factor [Cellulomonas hominis]VTR75868.1 A-factor receptor protein [Cellulomonas hominis]